MVSNLYRRGVELRRLKKQAERWIPRPLHRPLLKAFSRVRRIGS